MPAFYIFDRHEQSGPFKAKQIAAMWKQGLLTANARYFDDFTREWRDVSELLAQKRLERKIELWICVPIGVIVLLFVVGVLSPGISTPSWMLSPGGSSSASDSLESERQHLVREGNAIGDAMEKANRDKDRSHNQGIRERQKEFYRRSAEYMFKREKVWPTATP